MIVQIVRVVALMGSGTAAGVLFAVALSTAPALAAMTPDRYIHAHKLLGRNWDPTMPLIVVAAAAANVALAALDQPTSARTLSGIAAVLLAGVSFVSHLCNVPINKRMRAVDENAIPAGWVDPRPVWRNWHLLRTALAFFAFGLTACAVAVA